MAYCEGLPLETARLPLRATTGLSPVALPIDSFRSAARERLGLHEPLSELSLSAERKPRKHPPFIRFEKMPS